MADFTDADAIKVGRMIADGKTWRDMVDELYPDTEYPELMQEFTYERFHHWYKRQTPERLIEVFCPPSEILPCPFCGKLLTEENIEKWGGMYQVMHECDRAEGVVVNTRFYFDKRSAIGAWNRRVR